MLNRETGTPVAAAPPIRIAAAPGASLVIRGELTGSEDLLIEGRVEGKISVPGRVLMVGAHATISADVVAKAVIIRARKRAV